MNSTQSQLVSAAAAAKPKGVGRGRRPVAKSAASSAVVALGQDATKGNTQPEIEQTLQQARERELFSVAEAADFLMMHSGPSLREGVRLKLSLLAFSGCKAAHSFNNVGAEVNLQMLAERNPALLQQMARVVYDDLHSAAAPSPSPQSTSQLPTGL